jgi:hypothetical protein
MSVWLMGILVVGGSTLLAVAGLLLVRRLVPLAVLRENNEVCGFMLAVLAVAYGVVLAFVVISQWDDFQGAKLTVETEANHLAAIFRLAQGLPEPARHHVQGLLRTYAQVVVEEEWPAMDQGKESRHAWDLLDRLWQAIRDVSPSTVRENPFYPELLRHMDGLNDQRRLRLLASRDGLHPLVWIVLIVGAAILVLFTYFFGLRSIRAQVAMTAMMTLTITINLFLINAIDYPFTGDLRVEPEAFRFVLERTMGTEAR